MARPRSDEKRTAILEAATRIIVAQGLSAPTAGIAKEARIANGSFFTYFETKADLLNQLYLELKRDMSSTAMRDVPEDADLREQIHQIWRNWMNYALSNPEKKRALAQLTVSDEITPATRAAGAQAMGGVLRRMEQLVARGPLRHTSMKFAGALINSMAEATMDAMLQDPEHAHDHCEVGFETLWRAIG